MTDQQLAVTTIVGGIIIGGLIIAVKVWIILYITKKIIGWIKNK